MNWIDFFILFVLFLALLSGYRRGIFKEVSTLIGLLIAVIFTVSNAGWLSMKLEGRINMSPSVLYVFSFILVLAVFLVILKIVGRYFYRLVKITPMTFGNKIGGGIFGVLKGAAILSLLFILFVFPTPFKNFDSSISSSALAKPIRAAIPFIYDNTGYFHPKSSDFLAQVQKGILLSGADVYAQNPRAALKDKAVVGMTDEDVETLGKLQDYFGEVEK